MSQRTLILGWGGEGASGAIGYLRNFAIEVDLVDGGSMAPQLLAHLDQHSHVILLGEVRLGGRDGEVLRLQGSDLERLHPLASLHEAVRQVELSEKQPKDFVVIVTEPGEQAAAALAYAARRQLSVWASRQRPIC